MISSHTIRGGWQRLHGAIDRSSGMILLLSVVFSPWAFGTTADWAIWCMNCAGYLLGALLLCKWCIRRFQGVTPDRWCSGGGPAYLRPSSEGVLGGDAAATGLGVGGSIDPGGNGAGRGPGSRTVASVWMVRAMFGLTVLALGYVLVSALNYRAVFTDGAQRLDYRECVPWLPHTYDRDRTWFFFWMYLGLACHFWAARDWLMGVDDRDVVRAGDEGGMRQRHRGGARGSSDWQIPFRIRRLLLCLCLNGALVAAEGLVQRGAGVNRLLFVRLPLYNTHVVDQYGPYAYRGNASQLMNLLWPVAVGLAWVLAREGRSARRGGRRVSGWQVPALVIGAVLMGAAPFVSSCRGGAIISALMVLPLAVMALRASAKEGGKWRLSVLLGACAMMQIGVVFGWDALTERFGTALTDDMSGRPALWANARQMLGDYPVFGCGPGSFASLYGFYRDNAGQTRESYAHDDWLETRITFGTVGSTIVFSLLAMVPLVWCAGTGRRVHWLLPSVLWLAIGGCLVHARFDFPFRIHSVTYAFLLLCCVLTCPAVSGRLRSGPG